MKQINEFILVITSSAKNSKGVRMANILYQHKSTKMGILKLCPVLNEVARYVFSERSSGGSEVKWSEAKWSEVK